MANKTIESLKELINNPENLDMGKMDSLVKESMGFFNKFMEVSKSGNKKEQEEALKELLEFKELLEQASKTATEQTGLNSNQLMEFISNPDNFSDEQKEEMDGLNKSISDFNTSLMKEVSPQTKSALKTRKALKSHYLAV
jgi:archaellum biogenesis ATPase FlaH